MPYYKEEHVIDAFYSLEHCSSLCLKITYSTLVRSEKFLLYILIDQAFIDHFWYFCHFICYDHKSLCHFFLYYYTIFNMKNYLYYTILIWTIFLYINDFHLEYLHNTINLFLFLSFADRIFLHFFLSSDISHPDIFFLSCCFRSVFCKYHNAGIFETKFKSVCLLTCESNHCDW